MVARWWADSGQWSGKSKRKESGRALIGGRKTNNFFLTDLTLDFMEQFRRFAKVNLYKKLQKKLKLYFKY